MGMKLRSRRRRGRDDVRGGPTAARARADRYRSGWNYAVLGIAAAFEGYSCIIAFRNSRGSGATGGSGRRSGRARTRRPPQCCWKTSPPWRAWFVSSSAWGWGRQSGALTPTRSPLSGIGLILAAIAVYLARESKDLLVGERAEPELSTASENWSRPTRRSRVRQPADHAPRPSGSDAQPRDRFREGRSAADLMDSIDRIESTIHSRYPEVKSDLPQDRVARPRATSDSQSTG